MKNTKLPKNYIFRFVLGSFDRRIYVPTFTPRGILDINFLEPQETPPNERLVAWKGTMLTIIFQKIC